MHNQPHTMSTHRFQLIEDGESDAIINDIIAHHPDIAPEDIRASMRCTPDALNN